MSEIISSLLEYFFATSESIFEFISKIQKQASLSKQYPYEVNPFLSKVNKTGAGSQPFQYGKGLQEGGLFIGVFTIPINYPPYYQPFALQYLLMCLVLK